MRRKASVHRISRGTQWRWRLAQEVDQLWTSLEVTYDAVEAMLRARGVAIARPELWRLRRGDTGVSFEKILWTREVLENEWEREFGIRTAKDVMIQHLHWLSTDTPVGHAVEELERLGFSQAPVRDQNGRYRGVLVRESVAGQLARGRSRTAPVEEFMEDPIKVHLQTGLKKLRQIFGEGKAFVLVEKRGEVVGIISYTDLYTKETGPTFPYAP